MAGPVFAGAYQLISKAVVSEPDTEPVVTTGGAGAAGASSSTSSMSILTVRSALALLLPVPSSTVTVTEYEGLVSSSRSTLVMSCPVEGSMSNEAPSVPPRV